MTIVGKILVFVNLIFSLIVGGLVMMVYTTRTNWEDAYNKLNTQYKAVEADRTQTLEDLKTTKNDLINQRDAALKAKTDAEKTAADLRTEVTEKAKAIAALEAKERNKLVEDKSILTASEARNKQVAQLNAMNAELREEVLREIREKNEERANRIKADIEKRTFQARSLELETQVKDMARELIKAKSGPGGFVVRKTGDENPPPDNVEGRIKEVDTEDNLVRLSIGSDAGLEKGHTLKVFRLDPIPEKSRYLGTIEILVVRPHEAVGRPTSRIAVSLKPGDRVASRLTVGGN